MIGPGRLKKTPPNTCITSSDHGVCVCLAMIDRKKTIDQKKGIKDGQVYSNRFSSSQLFEPPLFVNRTRNRLHVELRLICRSPNDKIETKLLDNSEPHYCQT